MSAGITYVTARDLPTAKAILSDAILLATTLEYEEGQWPVVFRAAVDLLSAGSIVQTQPAAMGLDLSTLRTK